MTILQYMPLVDAKWSIQPVKDEISLLSNINLTITSSFRINGQVDGGECSFTSIGSSAQKLLDIPLDNPPKDYGNDVLQHSLANRAENTSSHLYVSSHRSVLNLLP